MQKTGVVLVFLLSVSVSLADFHTGVVVAVDKETFTIKPEVGEKVRFTFFSEMKGFANPHDPHGSRQVAPDEIKVGMIVRVMSLKGKSGELVCHQAIAFAERLGMREIDFGPMLPKGKDKLREFVLSIKLQSREGLGRYRPLNLRCDFNEGASIKDVRDFVKCVLSGLGKRNHKLISSLRFQGAMANADECRWQVKEEGNSKLLIEAFRIGGKDEPVNAAEVEVKKFPKERQPRIRILDPRDPTKSLEPSKDGRSAPNKDRK